MFSAKSAQAIKNAGDGSHSSAKECAKSAETIEDAGLTNFELFCAGKNEV